MLIWLGVGLRLMFAIAVGAKGFSLGSFLLSSLRTPQIESACISSFSSNPLLIYWSPVDLVVKCGGGKAFYNLRFKLSLVGLCPWTVTFTSVS